MLAGYYFGRERSKLFSPDALDRWEMFPNFDLDKLASLRAVSIRSQMPDDSCTPSTLANCSDDCARIPDRCSALAEACRIDRPTLGSATTPDGTSVLSGIFDAKTAPFPNWEISNWHLRGTVAVALSSRPFWMVAKSTRQALPIVPYTLLPPRPCWTLSYSACACSRRAANWCIPRRFVSIGADTTSRERNSELFWFYAVRPCPVLERINCLLRNSHLGNRGRRVNDVMHRQDFLVSLNWSQCHWVRRRC